MTTLIIQFRLVVQNLEKPPDIISRANLKYSQVSSYQGIVWVSLVLISFFIIIIIIYCIFYFRIGFIFIVNFICLINVYSFPEIIKPTPCFLDLCSSDEMLSFFLVTDTFELWVSLAVASSSACEDRLYSDVLSSCRVRGCALDSKLSYSIETSSSSSSDLLTGDSVLGDVSGIVVMMVSLVAPLAGVHVGGFGGYENCVFSPPAVSFPLRPLLVGVLGLDGLAACPAVCSKTGDVLAVVDRLPSDAEPAAAVAVTGALKGDDKGRTAGELALPALPAKRCEPDIFAGEARRCESAATLARKLKLAAAFCACCCLSGSALSKLAELSSFMTAVSVLTLWVAGLAAEPCERLFSSFRLPLSAIATAEPLF